MLKLFQSLLQTKFSFLKEAPVLVAVSGGLDSMVLVDLCNQSGLNSSLAHCNFKLRGMKVMPMLTSLNRMLKLKT